MDGCFLRSPLHYNYGLEGYQLNVSNYRMLQNWNIKLRLLF